MAEFVWEARARTGELRKGAMEAEDEAFVMAKLRNLQMQPLSVKKKRKAVQLSFGSGVSTIDLVTFTRLFATMIDAGLPIVQCLDILGGQTANKIFANVLRDIKAAVEGGSTFSDSLRRHPKVFDALFVHLVQAGEIGGILDTILTRLAAYYEKAMKLARQVKGALVYPTSVLVIFTAVLGVMLGWVIPSFQKIFTDLGSPDDLPGLTKLVIATSQGFIHNLPFVLVIGAAIAAGVTLTYRKPKGKRFFHALMLKAPVMGDVMRKIAVARFTRTMGTLLSSGVPILDALDIVAKTAGNVVVEEALIYCKTKISEGCNLVEPLTETKVFPTMVTQMIGVGEQTGQLDQMLSKIADFYDDEVDAAVAAMTRLIEPIMMVTIGSTVGVVLISMYLPIFSMAGKIKAD